MKKMLLAAVLTAGMAGSASAQGVPSGPETFGYLSGSVSAALATTLAVVIIATAVSEGSSGTN